MSTIETCPICGYKYIEGDVDIHICDRSVINQSRPMVRGTYNVEWANDVIKKANGRANKSEEALQKIMKYIENDGLWMTVIYDIAEEALKDDKE